MMDIEQRAQKMLNDIHRRKAEKQAGKIFREPERKKAKEQAKKEAIEREIKEKSEMYNPWLVKAQERIQQEQAEYKKLMNKYLG